MVLPVVFVSKFLVILDEFKMIQVFVSRFLVILDEFKMIQKDEGKIMAGNGKIMSEDPRGFVAEILY